MSLNQQLNTIILSIDIPEWSDTKTIIEDCQEYCTEILVDKLSEKFEDSIKFAEKLNDLVEKDANLDAYEKLAIELLWQEKYTNRQSEILSSLKNYLSTEE